VDFDEATVKSVEAMAHALAIKATTASFEERGRAVRDLDILMRQTTGVAKAKAVATFTAVVVEAGEPVLLFGWHREVYAIWQKAFTSMGVRFGMYTGSETSAEKERNKNAFLAGETDILILSLRSGSGLDGLQARCSTAIFGELDWSPGVHHQCIGRLDREGQTSPVTAIFLTVDEGSDPPMIEVLGLKKTESSGILDPGLGVQAVRSDASHLQTLVQRYLRKRAT
jgi:superfamily II DNA or RNA helicase